MFLMCICAGRIPLKVQATFELFHVKFCHYSTPRCLLPPSQQSLDNKVILHVGVMDDVARVFYFLVVMMEHFSKQIIICFSLWPPQTSSWFVFN